MQSEDRAIAIVGVGAILPDAPSAPAFWNNILDKKYSITDVPPERWRIEDYYDPDPGAPDKTYSKIGGWVRGFEYDWRRFRMPPKVAAAMDEGQQWAVTIAAEVLEDYGYPERPLNTENTAVILGTAMGGEMHYITHQRIAFPEFANALAEGSEFASLPEDVRSAILRQWHERIGETMPPITEDTMPGELPNIVSGRVANMLNLRGPNFITDAACASSFAAVKAAMELLLKNEVDAVITGGVDRNMGTSPFVKFCKIGALSATGSRPFAEGADGFVMGEGSAAFLLKRLEDAERNGDKIYAVIRGVAGSSDGKGKGITAPNPVGQELAIQRAWQSAGLDPATATMIEAHGTSTPVGDVVEVESLAKVFAGAARNSIGLGSAKSNIGHLKAGAGAAGLLKATMALHHKILPPTLNAERPNPYIDFEQTPFYLLHEAQEWQSQNGVPRRCGVSAYGFGGTNFHIVMEEYIPGHLTNKGTAVSVSEPVQTQEGQAKPLPRPFRGILAIGAGSPAALQDRLDAVIARVESGWTPSNELPSAVDIQSAERLIIDFADHDELVNRLAKARKVMGFDNPQAWEAMQAQGIFRGSGAAKGKIAFMFPGQGSQYVNMGRELVALSPVVAEVFAEADEVMAPVLGRPLTSYIFIDEDDSAAMMQAQFDLLQTEITQPAMLAMDIAMMKLLAEYGFEPEMVVGHSLGEYAALIAAGALPFADALEAVAARGSEMSKVSWEDNGRMAAVLAPYDAVMDTLARVDGYVVPANINSSSQSVIGGASDAVEQASTLFEKQGFRAIQIPVSHAFHTEIVAPASGPLREVLDRLRFAEPRLPVVANVTGDYYPQTVEEIKEMLQVQVASPVQWVKGMETLYAAGMRTFVEVGPKRALRGFARDIFKGKEDVLALLTNHPKTGELPAFNQALCGLYAAGYLGNLRAESEVATAHQEPLAENSSWIEERDGSEEIDLSMDVLSAVVTKAVQDALSGAATNTAPSQAAYDRNLPPTGSVVISGTGLGLPGAEKAVMDPDNVMRILRGEQFVDLIPERFRSLIVKKRITRVVKSDDGSGSFQTISDPAEVIKLAGRPGQFDLEEEYGVPSKLIEALDITSQLAIAAGLDAMREAGIPLVQTYRRTTTDKYLPDRWLLPEALRDETGIIFASAFPGNDRFANEFKRYYAWQNRLDQLAALEDLRRYTTDTGTLDELDRRAGILREEMEADPYSFDRRFLFRILSMGHSQFAQYIGARGPNTQLNAACASTAQGVALAEDWIRSGRCRRVIIIGADAVTSDDLLEWMGAGFLSIGATTTKDRVDEAALPFDARRHGTIMGMGACGLVVESEDALRERGMRGIVELLSSETSNSAFHGTRLDLDHISMIMEELVASAEHRFGLNRYAMAPNMVFMSHETYTPARGGSAAAEIVALRETFGRTAGDIVIANTKGFTGHPMGVGVEDVIAVKILEHGIVPPVPNFKEVDPALGVLNLSRGGRYPVQYALHLAAGFGSQISMTLTRRIPGGLDRIDDRGLYERWLANVSGNSNAPLEVNKRVLRVVDQGKSQNKPAASTWRRGTGPIRRAVETVGSMPDTLVMPAPAPMPQPAPQPISPIQQETPQPDPIPAPPPSPSIPDEAPSDPLTDRIISLVAEQTGYPPDMLDLYLDLEADLGIDTVKQAETFTAIQEEFAISAQESLSLRDYNTLEKVIGFVYEMRPDLAKIDSETITDAASPQQFTVPAAEPIQTDLAIENESDPTAERVIRLVAEQTGYPIDMLELDLDLEADLGVDTVKQAETFLAIREMFDIPQQDDLSLRDYNTLEKVIGYVKEMRPDLADAPGKAAEPIPIAAVTEPEVRETTPAVADDTGFAGQVLSIVAEQTGYPIDMLELDLDLEADLGVDTVKQAETFLAIREMFDIPQQDDLSLRDYNTLEKVIGYVKEMRPDLAGIGDRFATPETAVPSVKPDMPQASSADADAGVAGQVLIIVAEQTGYPIDMLELDLDLEADLGVDTVKQAETFLAIREMFDIPQRDDLSLRDYNTLEKVIGFVHEMRPDLAVETAAVIPAAEPVPATAAEDSGESPADSIASQVLKLVAEQTGYPEDMLELDLDLEADLGVDTVKQAETFLAIRETFDIPQQDELSLRDYNTLEKVIGYVQEMRPDLVEHTPSEPRPAPSAIPLETAEQPESYDLAEADKMPRRIPTPVLRPDLDLCKPTGVVLAAGSRIVIMPDQGGVSKALATRLKKLGALPLLLDPTAAISETVEQIESWLDEEPVQGVYWLAALDVEPDLESMSLDEWRVNGEQRVKKLYAAMRTLYEAISTPNTFLVAATRLGGLHGYGEEGASAPMGGAVTGFAKAFHIEQRLRREGSGPLVKVVDFALSRKTAALAERLITETQADPGVVEVGIYEDRRYGIALRECPAVDGRPGMTLGPDTVFLVSGAAGGITSEIVTDLALNSQGIFYLLDLVEAPDPADADVQLLRSDREALKQKLIEDARAAGERPTPVAIEQQIAIIERGEAALRAIETVEAAGGTARYVSLNLLDAEAVAAVVKEIRERFGRIDVLIHAGGLLIDRTLPKKEPKQFNLVYDVKADGFFNILKAATGMPLGASVAFSSVAGRFGNNGQSDYSAANDLLCKIISSMRRWRPDTKAIAIDWTAWGEIGMAARGSVPTIMKALGIDMLPPASGVPTVRRELVAGGFSGEVLVAGELGVMVEEIDEDGGLDLTKANDWLAEQLSDLSMIGGITGAPLYRGVELQTALDPTLQPFLFDHIPDADTPWLPGVMAIESMAEAAVVLVPGFHVAAVTNVEMLGAFKFFRNETRSLYLDAFVTPRSDGMLKAQITLRSITPPAREGLPTRAQDHFRACVLLSPASVSAADVEFTPPDDDGLPAGAQEIYKIFFHGPAYQVIDRAGVTENKAIGRMSTQLPPNSEPSGAHLLMAPRLVELCFQTAAHWSVVSKEAMAFPLGLSSLTVYHQEEEASGSRLFATVITLDDGGSFDGQVVDETGRVFVDLQGYRTVSRPGLPA